jgi:hypothetical protein
MTRLRAMRVQKHIVSFWIFARSKAPFSVLYAYYKRLLLKLWAKVLGKDVYNPDFLMAPINEHGKFSTNWFDVNANDWIDVFDSEKLTSKPINILEIGSWEGRSTSFFLHYLKSAHLTAVDTWEGGDEHKGDRKLSQIETLFDSNVSRFSNRVTKMKSTSRDYFCKKAPDTLSTPFKASRP